MFWYWRHCERFERKGVEVYGRHCQVRALTKRTPRRRGGLLRRKLKIRRLRRVFDLFCYRRRKRASRRLHIKEERRENRVHWIRVWSKRFYKLPREDVSSVRERMPSFLSARSQHGRFLRLQIAKNEQSHDIDVDDSWHSSKERTH